MINVESHYFRIHPKRFINGKTIHFPALITKAAYRQSYTVIGTIRYLRIKQFAYVCVRAHCVTRQKRENIRALLRLSAN